MVEIKDPIVADREKDFVPDEINFVNYVVRHYDNPIAPEPNEYAILEYDRTTETLIEAMRRQRSEEANAKGLTGKAKGSYIKPEVEKLTQESKDRRNEVIEKRTKELEIEIPEGLKKLKKLSPLEATIDDGIRIQDFMMIFFDVLPENVHLLAAEADANLIIKHVRVGGEESKDKQFYKEAENDVQRKEW